MPFVAVPFLSVFRLQRCSRTDRNVLSQPVLGHRLARLCVALCAFAVAVQPLIGQATQAQDAQDKGAPRAGRIGDNLILVTRAQAAELKVGPAETRAFVARREAPGIIDFNPEATVPVFAPYQGRIGAVRVRAGDDVRSGQPLFTVQIPDLGPACATLISTSGILKVADAILARARELAQAQSIPQKELQQNIADQQTAEANYRAAQRALGLFGLDAREIKAIEDERRVVTEMTIKSPLAGRVTTRAAAPGQLVQPGNAPAPVTVSDTRVLWMIASVPESEMAAYRLGQAISVSVRAYPERAFRGAIDYIADAVDPNTHRLALRAVIQDPQRLFRAQMLATFDIVLGTREKTVAVPGTAVARETDGSVSVWVTEDGLRFARRKVSLGASQAGMVEVTAGLREGEKVARDKALFLSNLYVTSIR